MDAVSRDNLIVVKSVVCGIFLVFLVTASFISLIKTEK